MKIMYVEDNPANISLLQRIARMGGHEVVNYTNGEVALNNFEGDKPDLVLMDLQLEGRVSGLEVVKQLRQRGFKTPIVAVTAYAMVGDRERCIDAGCDSYLSKPLPVAELVELVQKYEQKYKPAKPQPEAVKAAPEPPKTETPTQPSIDTAKKDQTAPARATVIPPEAPTASPPPAPTPAAPAPTPTPTQSATPAPKPTAPLPPSPAPTTSTTTPAAPAVPQPPQQSENTSSASGKDIPETGLTAKN